jgi:tRNA-2-methylthio-N6-dimethylallyladenosine synthase
MADGAVRMRLDDDPRALDDLGEAPVLRGDLHKSFVTIAHGCDQFCSYCIVPHVRGRFGSRAPGEILDEARRLVEGGVAEITLLGQNVNSYGKDLNGYRFAALLADVSAVPGLKRLRFTTSHPIDFSGDILDIMSRDRYKNICPSINLPVQSGNDKVLREMNRKYTRAEYLDTVSRIRDAMPNLGLTTDLIVGFPGETDEEFRDSVSLLEGVKFDLVHSAAYSPREGTPAAARTDQVPEGERAGRLVLINDLQREISEGINKSLVGRTFDVLLDGAAQKGEGLLQGRTVTDKVVLVRAPSGMAGEIRPARITGATPWCLEGELV